MKATAQDQSWLASLGRNWWLLAVRGSFALMFAAAAFLLQATLHTFVLQAIAFASVVVGFGLLALCAGLATLVAGMRSRHHDRGSWLLVLDGLLTSIAGLGTILLPTLTLTSLVRILGYWALLLGAIQLSLETRIRRHAADEWTLALAGGGSLAFGLFLTFRGPHTIEVMLTWLGFYAPFSSLMMFLLAFRLKRFYFAEISAAAKSA